VRFAETHKDKEAKKQQQHSQQFAAPSMGYGQGLPMVRRLFLSFHPIFLSISICGVVYSILALLSSLISSSDLHVFQSRSFRLTLLLDLVIWCATCSLNQSCCPQSPRPVAWYQRSTATTIATIAAITAATWTG
jgi:hypothetical protein